MAYDPYGGGLNAVSSLGSILGGLGGGAGSVGNPVALAAAGVGIGLSIYSGLKEAGIQQQEAKVSEEIGADEQAINTQRQILANFTYERQKTEALRKVQQGRSLARAAGTQAGAYGGAGATSSGVSGGEAQATAEGAFNIQGIDTNQLISSNIYGITSDINQKKIQMAQLGGEAAGYAGLGSIGQGLTGGAMSLGRLSGGFGAQS